MIRKQLFVYSFLVAIVAFQAIGCSHVPTLRQSASPSHAAGVGHNIVQSGDGSLWVTLNPLGPGTQTQSVAPGPDGEMWYTRYGSPPMRGAVGKVDRGGAFVVYPVSGFPSQIIAGPDGAMWFTESVLNAIGRITTSGTLTEYPIPPRFTRSSPNGITSGPDGNIWFTDPLTRCIGKITLGGVITYYKLPHPAKFRLPNEITSGPDGNVWFTLPYTNEVGYITPSGNFKLFSVPTPNSYPKGIALGADGNLYFTEWLGFKIATITPTGTITEYPLPFPDHHPGYIAPGFAGTSMWFDDYDKKNNTRLRQFIIRSKTFDPPLKPPTPTAGLRYLHAGPDGNMWVGDYYGPILIALTHVLTSNPASVDIFGVGQSQTIQTHETQYKGGSFTALSSDQSIATVAAGNQANSFVVTGQGVGSCTVRVSDSLGNYIDVPVSVSAR